MGTISKQNHFVLAVAEWLSSQGVSIWPNNGFDLTDTKEVAQAAVWFCGEIDKLEDWLDNIIENDTELHTEHEQENVVGSNPRRVGIPNPDPMDYGD